jgi:hypothetical protein
MTTLSPFPTPPSRNGSPDSFADDGDAFLGHFPTFQTEVNIVSAEIEANKNTATTQAGIATTAAGTATTQAGIATTAAGTATTQAGIATTKASEVQVVSEDFRIKYLGNKATDPLLNNEGQPLISGALYFNTTISLMRVFNGASWQDASSSVNGTANRYNYIATSGQTTFSATYDIGYVDVYKNGIRLSNSQFTANNTTTVILTTPAALNDSIVIIGYGNFLFSKPIPNELGNSDKFLGTDGTNLSWKNALTSNTSQPTVTYTQQGSGPTLKLTNTGSGLVLLVEDQASDTTPTIIDSSGNVSIGNITAGPEKLKVEGASNTTFASFGTAANKLSIKGLDGGISTLGFDSINSTEFQVGTNTNTVFSIITNAVQRLYITGDGRVGINKLPVANTNLDYRHTINSTPTVGQPLNLSSVNSIPSTGTYLMPPSPQPGDWITVVNASNTTTIVLDRNGSRFFGIVDNLQINTTKFNQTFVWINSTRGWVYA